MAVRNDVHDSSFLYNAIVQSAENHSLNVAESPQTYDGELPYLWIDQIYQERTQIAMRGTRQGDIYEFSAVIHIFYPFNRRAELMRMFDKIDGDIQKVLRHNMTSRIINEKDGTLHGLLNIN